MQTQLRTTRNSPMEERVLVFMQAHPQPRTSNDLIEQMPGCPNADRVREALRLLRNHDLITQVEMKAPGTRLKVLYELTERGKSHRGQVRKCRATNTTTRRIHRG